MRDLFIDCSYGTSGDMLLASLIDLGVPFKIIEEALEKLGINSKLFLSIEDSRNLGFKGKKVQVNLLDKESKTMAWLEIKQFIIKSKLNQIVKNNALEVFEVIAKAESLVHGIDIDKVHFHEIGSLRNIVNVVGACTALEYLDLTNIFSTYPPSGSGFIKTSHGELAVPVPVVLELAREHKITLIGSKNSFSGELTTPTGLALLIVYVDKFMQPESFLVKSIGVGLGNRKSSSLSLLRSSLIHTSRNDFSNNSSDVFFRSFVLVQEAWIDDSSPEEVAFLIKELRNNGAIEVASESIYMKKARNGISVKVLAKPEDAERLRYVWFDHGSSIGFRERIEDKWMLMRRSGTCKTKFGKVIVKQVKRSDGRLTLKPEFDELSRLSCETGIPLEKIREEILSNSDTFSPDQNWGF